MVRMLEGKLIITCKPLAEEGDSNIITTTKGNRYLIKVENEGAFGSGLEYNKKDIKMAIELLQCRNGVTPEKIEIEYYSY